MKFIFNLIFLLFNSNTKYLYTYIITILGTMAELQGVSEILGGLGDDDDELLAEMGADFNILEYADPELEALAGEKTNILDLDLEDDNLKQEKKKEAMQQKQVNERYIEI